MTATRSSPVKKRPLTTCPLPAEVQDKTAWKWVKSVVKDFLVIFLPPLFGSFLVKLIALLTGGVLIFQGISFFNGDITLSPIVMTRDGPVQGKLALSRNGSSYWQYLSIPYAKPPVGHLRFQPPVAPQPWKEVRQGLAFPRGCVQIEPIALLQGWGVEDCLNLNVFVKKNSLPMTTDKFAKRLPVIVYIHGGAFLEGQSSFYHPDYIMNQNVVLVTMNYRLGPLGFLNFQEKNDPHGKYPRGNMGLKDQRLCLEWVQKNIAQFGGDENQVTLAGDSAGAVSVHFLMTSPLSRNLFHRAILFSGSSLSPWGFTVNSRKIAYKYGNRLGCPTDNASSLFECYMNMDPHEMVKLQYSWAYPHHEKDEFVPSIEILKTEDTFLTNSPIDILRSGESLAKVPLMAGVTSGEGGLRSGRFRAMQELIPVLDENWNTLIDRVLFMDHVVPPEVAQSLKSYYFGNQSFAEDITAFLVGMTNLTSDSLFVGPVHTAAVHHAKAGNPTYMFYYNYRPVVMPASFSAFSHVRMDDNIVVSYVKLAVGILWDWISELVFGGEGGHLYGVGHAENCFQMWDIVGLTKWLTLRDTDFSDSLIQSVVDFASNSKPLTFRGVPWPQINDAVRKADAIPYMAMDNRKNPVVVDDPFRERMEFWNKLRSKCPTI